MKNDKGFTLAELLIVVAIIAVLVAISIPILNSQLERSREATDLANVRSAYAEVITAATTEDKSSETYNSFKNEYIKTVYLKQKQDGWIISSDKLNIGGIQPDNTQQWRGDAKAGGRCDVVYDITQKQIQLIWDGYTVYPGFQWKIVGDKLYKGNTSYNSESWPASAVPEFISAKIGDELTVDAITEEQYPVLYQWMQSAGYEIGYFITDAEGKILVNSGGQSLKNVGSSFKIKVEGVDEGADVKIAIQFFKMKTTDHDAGSVQMTQEDARELEKIFHVG